MSSTETIIVKKKGKKKCSQTDNTLDSSLTSDCYTDRSSSSKTSCTASDSSSSRICIKKKKHCSSSSSSGQPSIEVIELSSSSSSSSSSSDNDCSDSGCCDKGCYGRNSNSNFRRNCKGGYRCDNCNRSNCNGNCRRIDRSIGECFYCFYAIVTPLSNFQLLDGTSNVQGLKITVSITGKTTTLMWQGFTGNIASSGIPFVSIQNFFRGLPMTDVYSSFLINYSGGDALSTVQILANNQNTICWYIQQNRKGTGISSNSYIIVYPGSVTFINNCNVC